MPPVTISVVIPAYNSERCLKETVESVLAQTRPADEIIIVNDGSTDETETIARSFGDRIRYISQPNQGIAGARNTGVAAATSEWIALFDHDDLMMPDKLEKQARMVEASPHLVVLYSAFAFLDSDGSTRPVPAFPARELWPALRYRTPILPSTSLVRRSAFLEVGGFRKLYCIDDWDLWFRLARRFSVNTFQDMPESLTLYRWWEGNESKNFMLVQEAVLALMDSELLDGLTGPMRWVWRRRIQARIYYGLALNLRSAGSDRAWEYMLESLILWPLFGAVITSHRYSVFAHMLYTRLRSFRFNFRYWWPVRRCREDMRSTLPSSGHLA